jgi:hypothetical protein
MVVLGDSGLPSGNTSLADANRMFREIGFGLSGAVVDITYATRILHRDALIGFERVLDPVLPAFPIVGSLGSEVSSHLVLEHREGGLVLASSVVLTSNRGGYAANGYFVYEEPGTGRTKWIVDPFAFFQKAFGAARRRRNGGDISEGVTKEADGHDQMLKRARHLGAAADDTALLKSSTSWQSCLIMLSMICFECASMGANASFSTFNLSPMIWSIRLMICRISSCRLPPWRK